MARTIAPPPTVPEWARRPGNALLPRKAVEAIARRRRQMLVHSYIYYVLDDNVISDDTWTEWAQQLRRLQSKYGKRIGFYDKLFADWNGSTGHHLGAHSDPDVARVAQRTLDAHRAGLDLLVSRRTLAAMEKHLQSVI